jgi:hypothetical protein
MRNRNYKWNPHPTRMKTSHFEAQPLQPLRPSRPGGPKGHSTCLPGGLRRVKCLIATECLRRPGLTSRWQPHNLDRATSVARNRLRNASDQSALKASSAVRAKHNQVSVPFRCQFDNSGSRITLANSAANLKALWLEPLDGSIE